MTIICTDAEVEVLPLLAVMVYAASGAGDVAVPEIAPVVLLKLKPAGNTGVMLYMVAVPLIDGISGVIACPTVIAIETCG